MKTDHKHNPLQHLPQYKADDDLWTKIANQLDSSTGLSHKLPQHTADDAVWTTIVNQLDKSDRDHKRTKTLRYLSWASGAAASILIAFLMVSSLFKSPDKHTLTHTIEKVNQSSSPFSFAKQTGEEKNFAVICGQYPEVCGTPEFTKLNQNWTQLKQQLQTLQNMPGSQNDERINLYINRLENDIKQLEYRMMHMFL